MFIFDFIVFVLVLGVIILIHEAGHFYFAKKAGILCHEFSIGMGPAIYQKRKGETVYSIRSIPIGGYVSMAGESINDALIKKEQVVGVKLNASNQVYQIILNSDLESDHVGIVKSYDLYGKDFDPLFIELDIKGEITKFPVQRDAIYRFAEKKEMWITPAEKSFESKTLWQRFMVIFAGPLMNFILAIFLFLIVGFFVGKPNLATNEVGQVGLLSPAETINLKASAEITALNGQVISSWGDLSQSMRTITSVYVDVSFVHEGTLYEHEQVVLDVFIQMAGITNVNYDDESIYYGTRYHDEAKIGYVFGRAKSDGKLQPNDEIIAITLDGVTTPISNWDDLVVFFQTYKSGHLEVVYLRDGVEGIAKYEMISERALAKLGYQGLVFQLGVVPTAQFNLGYSLIYPFRQFYGNTMQVFNTLGLLFDRQENLGLRDLSGPVGIFSLVSNTASQGIIPLIGFTAFLSINIGLLNLLPIPALDGGRLIFLGVEAITKKPLNRKLENTINNAMFFLLLGLFVFVTYNDILRLIRG